MVQHAENRLWIDPREAQIWLGINWVGPLLLDMLLTVARRVFLRLPHQGHDLLIWNNEAILAAGLALCAANLWRFRRRPTWRLAYGVIALLNLCGLILVGTVAVLVHPELVIFAIQSLAQLRFER